MTKKITIEIYEETLTELCELLWEVGQTSDNAHIVYECHDQINRIGGILAFHDPLISKIFVGQAGVLYERHKELGGNG